MSEKTMWDYLSAVTPNNNVMLDVKPNKVITEEGSKSQVIHMGDDGSEERISLSDDSIFYCMLIWTIRSASDAGTVMDFYHDSAKGNGMAESFKWLHPTDGHIYTVRFDGKLKRQLISAGNVFYSFPSVRLRILGTGEMAIGASDLESVTEITSSSIERKRLVTAPDLESVTEITAPQTDRIRATDASNLESATEITAPTVGVV